MTTEPNRQPQGIPTGGQFAKKTLSDDVPALGQAFNFDTPEDRERFEAAAAFIAECDTEGTVEPLFTQYRPEEGLDTVILKVDGRNMLLRHAGTKSPQIEYGDDDAWTFRLEPGDTANKTEYEILAELVTGARHDAACQEAWRRDPSGETFQHGESVNVNDFGVRFDADGTRIITVDIDNDGRHWELVQRGNEDVKVFIEGNEVPVPHIQLDALAFEFDEYHSEGMGDIAWKSMMKDAADRAAKDPGYSQRGIDRP